VFLVFKSGQQGAALQLLSVTPGIALTEVASRSAVDVEERAGCRRAGALRDAVD